MPAGDASAWLERCCGAPRWVERMAARRPFGSREALLAAAREEWFALSRDEWIDAFRRHPRLGDREALRTKFASTRAFSEAEQAGVTGAADVVLDALSEGNRRYEERFGYIFIACASGQSAEALLASLTGRLANEPDVELGVAAEEHAKITALRLVRA